MQRIGVIEGMARELGDNWRGLAARAAWPMALYIVLALGEWFFRARWNEFISLDPNSGLLLFADPFLSRLFLVAKVCVLGWAVWRTAPGSNAGRFWRSWVLIAVLLGAALFVNEALQSYFIFMGGGPLGQQASLGVLLATLYVAVTVALAAGFWLALTAARAEGEVGAGGFGWGVRLGIALRFLIVYLAIDWVIRPVLLYVPLVSPFWFPIDELSSLRYFVTQGSGVAAETVGLLVLAVFFVQAGVALRRLHGLDAARANAPVGARGGSKAG